MTPPAFATFKYQHADKPARTPARMLIALVCLVAAVPVGLGLAFPVGVFVLVLGLIVWFAAPRHLLLGPRYLLCGKTIVYFGNVKRMNLHSTQGKLRLDCANGTSFVLERDKFPTGARKPAKIAKNKAAKFDKVATKIMDKVRAATADSVQTGGQA